ncbi:PREDICTED: zinc finger CCCH domain-containing protein 4-like [Mandrillus leucophaeus]|uniref:zinc finger CCCH domain-containing protein 4-like n=1 Tax=Mandrillus leucophaeus TaxID=9568 RepID=UPI0005F37EB0|nr:PREDICTED: zinc finger CCCH domain-containing protein 4-like [Mandrillus leucophaeus]
MAEGMYFKRGVSVPLILCKHWGAELLTRLTPPCALLASELLLWGLCECRGREDQVSAQLGGAPAPALLQLGPPGILTDAGMQPLTPKHRGVSPKLQGSTLKAERIPHSGAGARHLRFTPNTALPVCTAAAAPAAPQHDLPPIHLQIYLSLHPPIHSSIPPSIIHPSVHPCIHLSIHPFIYPSIHPTIHSSIYSSNHPPLIH